MIGGSIEKYHEADLESFNDIQGLDTTVSLVYGKPRVNYIQCHDMCVLMYSTVVYRTLCIGLLGNKWELLCLTDGEKWTFCKGTDTLISITGEEEGENSSVTVSTFCRKVCLVAVCDIMVFHLR